MDESFSLLTFMTDNHNKKATKTYNKLSEISSRTSYTDPEGGVRWVVNAKPRPLYPRKWPSNHCTGGWIGSRASLDGYGNFYPTGIR
jgi:hypothetical protein